MTKTLQLTLSMLACSILLAKNPSRPIDFIGNWVLDTSRTKNLPQGLDRCAMSVAQNEQQLKVQALVEGDLRPAEDDGRTSGRTQGPGGYPGSPGGYPGRGGIGAWGVGVGGIGMPSGRGPMGEGIPGAGVPGGGRGTSRGMSRAQGGVAALTLYPRSAIYKLDGSESTGQFGGPMQSDATLRADWEKGGKTLKLSLVGNGEGGAHGVQLKDEWKTLE
jgi:hypothetical protein